jgi:hypothetical protein
MARRKTPEKVVRAKLALAGRLLALRSELFGERGGPEMARRLGIPVRTWYNYEAGVTVPADIILKILKLTSVEVDWLLEGQGPRFRPVRAETGATTSHPRETVGTLLRTALHLLENSEATGSRRDGESAVPESADGSPAASDPSGTSQDLHRVHGDRWSEQSAREGAGRARHDRRQA